MNNVIINRGQGGLGRQPLGQDYISGLVFYTTKLFPVGSFTSSGTVLKFGGISDAIAAGITNTHDDETQAVYESALATGATGDIISIYMLEPNGNNVLLATYTQTIADTSDTFLAQHIGAAITANQSVNGGYTGTNSAGSLRVTMRPGLGKYPNASPALKMTASITGTLGFGTVSVLAGNDGVGSVLDVWYYHINRFFTQSPGSTLYVGLYSAPAIWNSSYAYPEVSSMQVFANGAIRQLGVYIDGTPFDYAGQKQVTSIQSQVDIQIGRNCPLSVFIGADMTGVTLSELTDLSTLNSEHVSVVAGQDGGAEGFLLCNAYGKSITQLGDIVGLVSRSQVSDDIAWVSTYTLSPDGIENAVPALAVGTTGTPLSVISDGDINSIDTYRYIFGRQFINDSPNGTFVNDSHCATAYTSDYAYIENNRTFDKAARQLYAAYIEQLAAPLVVNPDGTLTGSTVAFFEGLGEQALSNMAQANPNTGRPELSGFKVFINPAQNVLQSSSLVVSVKLQPVGVAREIILNLQFTVTL